MNKPKKYRKIPVIIEAIQFLREENMQAIIDFAGDALRYYPKEDEYYLYTLEGEMKMKEGFYIIKGVDHEFYPIVEEIFLQTYEPVEEDEQ